MRTCFIREKPKFALPWLWLPSSCHIYQIFTITREYYRKVRFREDRSRASDYDPASLDPNSEFDQWVGLDCETHACGRTCCAVLWWLLACLVLLLYDLLRTISTTVIAGLCRYCVLPWTLCIAVAACTSPGCMLC